MASGKVIPFSCYKCGDTFELAEGGVCSSCNNLFCRSHLASSAKKGQQRNTCLDCVNKLQKFIDFKRNPGPKKKTRTP